MNTQFKVGQEFKDKGGYLLKIVNIYEDRFTATNEPYQMVVFHREYLGDTEVTVRIGPKIQSLIDSGELTEVKKLSAAERMLEWLQEQSLESAYTDFYRDHCLSHIKRLNHFINEEKNG